MHLLVFIYSISNTALPFNNEIGVMFLSVLSIGVITVLCLLDLIFQERMLVGNFVELIELEKKYDWLPKIHHNMLSRDEHHAAPTRKIVYYIGCSLCLFLIVEFSLISYLKVLHNLFYQVSAGLALACVAIVYILILIKVTGKFEVLVTLAKETHKNRGVDERL